ncbi:MAG TPA: hypothetical protein VK212_06345 [Lentimicrobium sp.]|nr:hypothetical protein [Lentimicrobium sp.]
MKIYFVILIVLHGLVHLIGFLRGYNLMQSKGFHVPVSKASGLLWLLSFILFELAAIMHYNDNQQWWIIGSIAVVLSQILIVLHWKDTKFGTIPNIIIIYVLIIDYGIWHFSNSFSNIPDQFMFQGNVLASLIQGCLILS